MRGAINTGVLFVISSMITLPLFSYFTNGTSYLILVKLKKPYIIIYHNTDYGIQHQATNQFKNRDEYGFSTDHHVSLQTSNYIQLELYLALGLFSPANPIDTQPTIITSIQKLIACRNRFKWAHFRFLQFAFYLQTDDQLAINSGSTTKNRRTSHMFRNSRSGALYNKISLMYSLACQ